MEFTRKDPFRSDETACAPAPPFRVALQAAEPNCDWLDGAVFLMAGVAFADIAFTEQTGTANPFNTVDVGSSSAPSFVDIDNDGDFDAFIGEFNGAIKYYKNTSSAVITVSKDTDSGGGSTTPGSTNVPFLQLGTVTDSGAAFISSLKAAFTTSSTAVDADIDSFDLYHDVNGDGAVDGGDSLLGSATFSSEAATVTGFSFGVGETSKKLLLVLDIASGADSSHVVGLQLTSNSFITASSGSVASSNFAIASSSDSSLPVELSLFTAEASHGQVMLKWRTESETNNLGFHIYRSEEKAGEYVRITSTLISGQENTAVPHDYNFFDKTAAQRATYWYLIEDVDIHGIHERSDSIEVQFDRLKVIPTHFVLYQNFPNPFNPETWIPYELAADVPVSITIYDTQGNRIRTLSLGTQSAGSYRTKDWAAYWDGRSETGESVSSGVYFYHFQASAPSGRKEDLAQNLTHFAATEKMLILK